MSTGCRLLMLGLCLSSFISALESTYVQEMKKREVDKELELYNERVNEDAPVWWHTCSDQLDTPVDISTREEPLTKYAVNENLLEALIRVLPDRPEKMALTKHYSIETKMTLTRRTIYVKDTFRSTSFKSLNPKLLSYNMSLHDFQPYFSREMHVTMAKCYWSILKLKNTGKLCFGPIFKSIKELLCSRFNCYPQNWMLLRLWLPKFHSLVTHNASRVYHLSDEFKAMELFVQMIAATLEAFHHNERVINGHYLSLVSALNQCTIDLLCSLRHVIEQLEVIRGLSRVPMIISAPEDFLNPNKLLFKRGKSILRPMYKNRMLNFNEKVPRDLLPEQVILKESEENLRVARIASVAFDLEDLFTFLNEL